MEGSDGFFSDGYLPDLKIVNGLPFRYHSLHFEDPQEQAMAQTAIDNAAPGEVLTLSSAPDAVLVELFMPEVTSEEIMNCIRENSLQQPLPGTTNNSGEKTKMIVPIFRSRSCKWNKNPIPIYGGLHFDPSEAKFQNLFPLEPGFAITAHKSEGRTLTRIIISLSEAHNIQASFSYQQLHVALSRVRQGDHIRLLLAGNTEAEQWKSIAYIQDLKQDPAIRFFFDGFRDIKGPNPNLNWKTNAWDAERANDMYCERLHLSRPTHLL